MPATTHVHTSTTNGWLCCLCAQAMSNNYFLWMMIIVSVLAVCSKLIGAI